MTCYHPLKAYRSREKNLGTGKRLITFNPHKGLVEGSSFSVPCGKCIGCRIARSREWAARCFHEAAMHPNNRFLTLTYDQQSIPASYSVSKRDWQLFMHKLRQHAGSTKLRFLACGEYGDSNLRPHYHALLFNYRFADEKLYSVRRGKHIYKSDTLNKLWGKSDINEIGDVTYQSAAYVGRYIMKKIGGDPADDHYTRISPIDGQAYRVEPEFLLSSRRPGIGHSWLQKFKSDVFPSDFLIIDGRKHPVPLYYTRQLTEEAQIPIKRARERNALKQRHNSTKARLAVRELVQSERIKRLKRTL